MVISFNQLQSHPLAPKFHHLNQTIEALGGGVDFTDALNEVSALSDAVEAEVNQTSGSQTEAEKIADSVISWMVEHGLLDYGNEYYATDVVSVLNDLIDIPAQPAVGL